MPNTEPLLRWCVFHRPKHGHTESEYEDAWGADPQLGRFAVADGASESVFASLWARLLVQSFIAAPRPRGLNRWLDEPRRHWSAEVMDLDLPWYAENKRTEGSFATFLGVVVRPPQTDRFGRWRAIAVGDSCLIHVGRDGRVQGFPVQRSADFDNEPRLIGSRQGASPMPMRGCGSLQLGDRLLLMTDALAQWFLQTHERGGHPWEALAPLLSAAAPSETFADWVEELRERDGLRDDDVTLLTIAMGPGPEE